MSDDLSSPAENVDPLTAPNWKISEDIELVIAPPVPEANFVIENSAEEILEEPEVSKFIPQPPDVDQILRGEYTGWVPIIKPGDSLESATVRFEGDKRNSEFTNAQEPPNTFSEMFEEVAPAPAPNEFVNAEDLSEIKELIREIKAEPEVYVKDFYPSYNDLVEDPDTATSPAQALEEARRRIEQMRANLQVNLSRVAESFEHPIFEPKPVVEDIKQEDISAMQEIIREMKAESEAQKESQRVDFEYEHFDEPEVSQNTETQSAGVREEPVSQPITQTTTVVNDAPAKEDHSLELVIMRDEIKDLRDRLDASQKLIENLMDRLANLAELALTRKND